MTMNLFDKICAASAFVLGIVLLVLGALGLFAGCNANFTLPPILGVIPALVGWGMVKPILVAWKKPHQPDQSPIDSDLFFPPQK